MVLGKGSVLTVGVRGVDAALMVVGGAVLSASGVSHISGMLSAVELVLVLVSSVSLTELFAPPPGPCLEAGFLVSRPHFFKTGSRYFLRCSPIKHQDNSNYAF